MSTPLRLPQECEASGQRIVDSALSAAGRSQHGEPARPVSRGSAEQQPKARGRASCLWRGVTESEGLRGGCREGAGAPKARRHSLRPPVGSDRSQRQRPVAAATTGDPVVWSRRGQRGCLAPPHPRTWPLRDSPVRLGPRAAVTALSGRRDRGAPVVSAPTRGQRGGEGRLLASRSRLGHPVLAARRLSGGLGPLAAVSAVWRRGRSTGWVK